MSVANTATRSSAALIGGSGSSITEDGVEVAAIFAVARWTVDNVSGAGNGGSLTYSDNGTVITAGITGISGGQYGTKLTSKFTKATGLWDGLQWRP